MSSTIIEDNTFEFELFDENGSGLIAVEVLIFKGKKTISVNRYTVQSPMFHRQFRKKYEK